MDSALYRTRGVEDRGLHVPGHAGRAGSGLLLPRRSHELCRARRARRQRAPGTARLPDARGHGPGRLCVSVRGQPGWACGKRLRRGGGALALRSEPRDSMKEAIMANDLFHLPPGNGDLEAKLQADIHSAGLSREVDSDARGAIGTTMFDLPGSEDQTVTVLL